VNYRHSKNGGTIKDNFDCGLEGAWPVGMLVRHVLESPVDFPDFATVRSFLEAESIMAPTYFIIAGANQGEGVAITRDRDKIVDGYIQTLDGSTPCPLKGYKPITQTNVDCKGEHQHRDSRESAPRRVCSVFFLKEQPVKNKLKDTNTAWSLLNLRPINNAITLYTTVMVPATGFCETKVPDDSQLMELLGRLGACTHTTDVEVLRKTSTTLTEIRNTFLQQQSDLLDGSQTKTAIKRVFEILHAGEAKSDAEVDEAIASLLHRHPTTLAGGTVDLALPCIGYPFFLQMICSPTLGLEGLDDEVNMEIRITSKDLALQAKHQTESGTAGMRLPCSTGFKAFFMSTVVLIVGLLAGAKSIL